MRLASMLLVMIAACDLQPPPKKPVPVTPPTMAASADAAQVDPSPAPQPTGAGSGSAGNAIPPRPQPKLLEPTQDCLEAGSKIAQTMIDAATDVPTRNSLELERTTIVKTASQACTRDKWAPAVFACIRNALDQAAVIECTKSLRPPTEDQPDPRAPTPPGH